MAAIVLVVAVLVALLGALAAASAAHARRPGIQKSVERTRRLVVVHEAPVFFGSGAEIDLVAEVE